MLKNAPPGTELIISAFAILVSIGLIFGLIYSWFIMGSQTIGMVFAGFIIFIVLMMTAYITRRDTGGEEEEDQESKENSVSLDPNDTFEEN